MSKLSELLAAARTRATIQSQQTGVTQNGIRPNGFVRPTGSNSNSNSTITQSSNNTTDTTESADSTESMHHYGIDRYGNQIEYNKEQWQFIQTVLSRKSCILIGAAGTGKTTSTRGAIESLLRECYIPKLHSAPAHKHLSTESPAIVAVSYTRRAVSNLKRAMPEELQGNCITIHKLLEYQPFFYEVFDEESQEYKKTMRFEPARNEFNKLPPEIRTIIIDESSMVSVDLFHKIWVALSDPQSVQFIFLGDIQQLPPVFGSAILGYKMLSLPTIELTTVYRQALESPIIRLAHRILSGNSIPVSDYTTEWNIPGQLKLHPWKKKISADAALQTLAVFFRQAYDSGNYNPDTDMCLIPFNKACGTDELNKHIANHIARKKNRITYEVIAGYNKHYFSVGDKILYEKEDAEILEIKRNPMYSGKWPQPPSEYLNYWGHLDTSGVVSAESFSLESEQQTEEEIDAMLESLAADVEDRVREASHILTIKLNDSEREVTIKTAADINNLVMSYALTIHKSQGSEWRKVFLILHQSHNTMMQRELLYTACTRAKEELYVICEPDSFTKGIQGQRIKGNTLAEKAQYFQGKLERGEESFLKEIL